MSFSVERETKLEQVLILSLHCSQPIVDVAVYSDSVELQVEQVQRVMMEQTTVLACACFACVRLLSNSLALLLVLLRADRKRPMKDQHLTEYQRPPLRRMENEGHGLSHS